MTERREPSGDPLGVRETTAWVMSRAKSVAIAEEALPALADQIARSAKGGPSWDHPLHWRGAPEATANYVLVLDALNFCFWGEPRWRVQYRGVTYDGYWALAAALRRAIERGKPLWDAHYLATITDNEVAAILAGEGEIPLFSARVRHMREVGQGLLAHADGHFHTLLARAQGSAATLVRLVVQAFPSFNDIAIYEGQEVRFYKRAQLLVSDIAGALHGHPLGQFTDMTILTAFADYKLPQVLRWHGVLRYTPDLAAHIDQRMLIPAGSAWEIEIRAATVQAVERLAAMLAQRGGNWPAWRVDWALWQIGQTLPPEAPPYHRTRTIFY